MDNTPKYVMIENPEWREKYQIWEDCTALYNSAVERARQGANNYHEVNEASHAVNRAKANLDYTEQYIPQLL